MAEQMTVPSRRPGPDPAERLGVRTDRISESEELTMIGSRTIVHASLLLLGVAAAGPMHGAPPGGDSRDANMTPEQIARRETIRARTLDDFEKNGVVPGQSVPDLDVVTLDGSPTTLSKLWEEKPTLLVTASLTCGRARERQPWVEEIAKKYAGRLNVAVLYTIEAHPIIDPSPYAEYSPEYENPARPGERAGGNIAKGLDRRQPTDLETRQRLAEEYKDLLRVDVPIVVDPMTNAGWEALGGGPNMGFLIGRDGKVEVKHGWFDGETMDRSIEHLLSQEEGTAAPH
jgi:hypothetical protein